MVVNTEWTVTRLKRELRFLELVPPWHWCKATTTPARVGVARLIRALQIFTLQTGLELENHVTLRAAEATYQSRIGSRVIICSRRFATQVEAAAILRIVTMPLAESPEGVVGQILNGSDTTIHDASASRIGALLEIGHHILHSEGDPNTADTWWEAGAFDALAGALKDGPPLEQEAAAWGIW